MIALRRSCRCLRQFCCYWMLLVTSLVECFGEFEGRNNTAALRSALFLSGYEVFCFECGEEFHRVAGTQFAIDVEILAKLFDDLVQGLVLVQELPDAAAAFV